MIDTIKLFPTVQPSGYPDKHDLVQKKLEKQHEVNKANELAKQKQTQFIVKSQFRNASVWRYFKIVNWIFMYETRSRCGW